MKKIAKLISVFLLSLIVCSSLTGCGVYMDYNDVLPYNNVYDKVSLKKVVKLLEEQKNNSVENEVLYLVYATSESATSSNAVVTINEQAIQYGIDKVYYLDCEKYYEDSAKRDDVEEKLGMKDASACPVVLMYVDGKLVVDWSKTSVKNKYDSSLTKLAYDIFYTRPNNL